MRTLFISAFLASSLASSVHAQCDCDFELGTDVMGFDGEVEGVEPGDRICVMAGEREFLRFQRIQGTADDPVVILNCGGRAIIHNTDRAYALVFEDDSRYFHLTGTGDESETYGFDISAPDTDPYPGNGLWLLGRSTNYEVDHLEIHDTGFAGVSAKTDPLCDGSADQGVFVQESSSFHDLWVHDTGGEGFYIGSTQSNGQTINCDGVSEVHQPHFLDGVELYDNLIEDTGWDGAQVGMARTGCRVHGNVIRRVGQAREEFQMQGLQIGTYSQCEVFGNVIRDGTANGIIILGADETFVHDNLIVSFESDGIYANHRDVIPGVSYRFAHNTIVDWGGDGLTVFGGMLAPSEALSNFFVGSGAGLAVGGDVTFTEQGNVVVADRAAAMFAGADDYHLGDASPARGAGVAVDGLDGDLEGYPRADPPSAGAYEWRDPTVDAGVTPRDAGSDVGPGSDAAASDGGGVDAGSADGDGGGCGCGAAPGGALWPLLALVLLRRRVTRRP